MKFEVHNSQRFIHVSPSEDYHALWRRLFGLGVDMLSAAVLEVASGHTAREPQNRKYATWEPPFDDHARLHRPELLALPGEAVKTGNHCVLGRETCGAKYPCEGCRFQEKNPRCAHGLWKCPLGNAICNFSCEWFNSQEKTA